VPKWLTVAEVLSHFGPKEKTGYKEFIIGGMKSGFDTPWEKMKGQVVIGSEKFVEEIAEGRFRGRDEQLGERSGIREIVALKPEAVVTEAQRYFGIKSDDIRKRQRRYTDARYIVCYLLRRHCLMGLKEIGEKVGLHYSSVGNAIRQMLERATAAQTKSLRELEAKFKIQ
jgi:hypothetical protein